MNKKLAIIIGVIVVAAVVLGYLLLRDKESNHLFTKIDTITGESVYTNLDYGFSIAYSSSSWEGPEKTMDKSVKADYDQINAVFQNTSNLEAIVIAGKAGDTESFNDAAAALDFPYNVATIGGIPALRYEFVTPINEEGSAYAKAVMVVFKGLKKGSITLAYQRIFNTEKEAKAADLKRFNEFLAHINFK